MNVSAIAPPPQCLSKTGDPPIELEEWLDIFDNYLEALDELALRPSRKRARLLNALGKEGQHIYKYLPPLEGQLELDVYEEARKKLEIRFIKERNVVMKHKFYTQPQRSGESLDEFVFVEGIINKMPIWSDG